MASVEHHAVDATPRRCIDWTGGQIKNDDCADDVKNVDLSRAVRKSNCRGSTG